MYAKLRVDSGSYESWRESSRLAPVASEEGGNSHICNTCNKLVGRGLCRLCRMDQRGWSLSIGSGIGCSHNVVAPCFVPISLPLPSLTECDRSSVLPDESRRVSYFMS